MATQPVPNHDELVEVFESMEESEAQVVHGLLESVGIDSIVFSREAPQDVLPGVGGVAVKVPADQAEEARRIIDDYRNNPPDDSEIIDQEEQQTEEP